MGPRGSHRRDQRQGRRDRPQGGRREPFRRRLDRADRPPAGLGRPDPRQDHLPGAGHGFHRAGGRPCAGRRRSDHHRDGPGHPRGQGRDLRRPGRVRSDRHDPSPSDLGLAAAERRQDAARHRHLGRADHALGAPGRRGRAQLLDRARGHARRHPLPRREFDRAGALHPQCRPAASGPRRRDDLPRKAGSAGREPRRVRRAIRGRHCRWLLRHHPGTHRRDRQEGDRAETGPPTRARGGAAFEHDDLDPAGPGTEADPGR